jgi:hypothetical protein
MQKEVKKWVRSFRLSSQRGSKTDPISFLNEKLIEAKPVHPCTTRKKVIKNICFQVSDFPFRKTHYCKVMLRIENGH